MWTLVSKIRTKSVQTLEIDCYKDAHLYTIENVMFKSGQLPLVVKNFDAELMPFTQSMKSMSHDCQLNLASYGILFVKAIY